MKQATHRWIALLATTAIAIYLCWLMVLPFVQVLMWATVLAIMASPLNVALRRRGRGTTLSAAITTAVVVLTVLIPLLFLGFALVREATNTAPAIEAFIRRTLDPESAFMKWLSQYMDTGALQSPTAIRDQLAQWRSALFTWTLGTLGSVLGILAQVFFVIFTLFYLLRDSDRILPTVRNLMPLTAQQSEAVLWRTSEVISASLTGVLLIAALQGLAGGLAFWVLGLPSVLLWGVVMFLFAMVPMVGPSIVWVPAAIYLAANGHWIKASLLTAWGVAVIGLLDNVLRPRLVGQKTRLHELVVFFSVLGGLQVFGVLGLIVGPVVVAITLALIEVLRQAGSVGE
jgi:predicted PurR-regulated permease PerM